MFEWSQDWQVAMANVFKYTQEYFKFILGLIICKKIVYCELNKHCAVQGEIQIYVYEIIDRSLHCSAK